jgi:uncharacterized protein YbjT (DUF2867 family)
MGATGQVGGHVVKKTKGTPSIEVVAAVRDVAKAKGLGVPVVHLDLDHVETLLPALENVDRPLHRDRVYGGHAAPMQGSGESFQARRRQAHRPLGRLR